MTTSDGPVSLTDRTQRAAVWAFAQAMVMRFAGLATHLVLARILLEDDFGLYALAMTVCTFATFMHQGGIQDVLVKRQRKFHVWANAAFWMVTLLGTVSALATMAVAPLIAGFFDVERPDELIALIMVAACVFPLTAAGAVCRARMIMELRFRELAWISSVHMVLDASFKIMLAVAGMGAMSFAYGAVAATAVHLVLCWYYAPVPVKWNPQVRKWRYLIGDGMLIVIAHLFGWCIDEGDYIVLGKFETEAVVGVYFLAYRIARQSMNAMTLQLGKVLFPALASMPPDRQIQAFTRAARLMAVCAMHLCFVVAVLADPLVRTLFLPNFYGAIVLVQIMCVGMALKTLSWPATSLLKAQGRFRLRSVISGCSVAAFFPLAIVGTYFGSSVGLALAVGIFHSVMAIVDLYAAMRPSGKPWQLIARIVTVPLLANALSMISGAAVVYGAVPAWQLSPWPNQLLQLLLGGITTLLTYALALRLLDGALWSELLSRVFGMIFRRRQSASSAPGG